MMKDKFQISRRFWNNFQISRRPFRSHGARRIIFRSHGGACLILKISNQGLIFSEMLKLGWVYAYGCANPRMYWSSHLRSFIAALYRNSLLNVCKMRTSVHFRFPFCRQMYGDSRCMISIVRTPVHSRIHVAIGLFSF